MTGNFEETEKHTKENTKMITEFVYLSNFKQDEPGNFEIDIVDHDLISLSITYQKIDKSYYILPSVLSIVYNDMAGALALYTKKLNLPGFPKISEYLKDLSGFTIFQMPQDIATNNIVRFWRLHGHDIKINNMSHQDSDIEGWVFSGLKKVMHLPATSLLHPSMIRAARDR